MTPTSATSSNNGDSMPVTIRVKKHKLSKPFLQTPGATAPPQSQQSAQSQLGNKTALSNKTQEDTMSSPTGTAMETAASLRKKNQQFNQTQPVINAFSDLVPPHQSPGDYMQFLEKQQREMFTKGGQNGPSQPAISPMNMN